MEAIYKPEQKNGNSIKLMPTKTRSKGLGGSDMGAVIGVDTFRTAFDVWNNKVNNVETESTYIMERGQFMEQFIADRFAKEFNADVYLADTMLQHPLIHYFYGSLDRYFTFQDGTKGVLECKHTTKYINEPLESHFVQVQWYMLITGLKIAYIAYDTPFEFKPFEIKANTQFQEFLTYQGMEFWEKYVMTKTPPPAMNLSDIKQIFKEAKTGSEIIADDITEEIIDKIKGIKSQIKELENQIESYEMPLLEFIKDAETIKNFNGDVIATYKNSITNRFDTAKFKADNSELYNKYIKPSQSRRLNLK